MGEKGFRQSVFESTELLTANLNFHFRFQRGAMVRILLAVIKEYINQHRKFVEPHLQERALAVIALQLVAVIVDGEQLGRTLREQRHAHAGQYRTGDGMADLFPIKCRR